jgi:tetratricopeptide (TPR) repeat protein
MYSAGKRDNILMPWFMHPGYLFLAGIALVFVVLLRIQALPFWLALKPLQLGHYNEALRRLNLVERLRFRSRALYFKGTVLMFAGRNSEAEEVFRKCLAASRAPAQKSIVLVNLGYALLEQSRFEEAARVLDEAIKLRPDGAVAYNTRAETTCSKGSNRKKRSSFSTAESSKSKAQKIRARWIATYSGISTPTGLGRSSCSAATPRPSMRWKRQNGRQ